LGLLSPVGFEACGSLFTRATAMCSKGMFAAEISRLKLFLLFALTFYFSLQDQLLFVVTKERSQKMFIASQPFNVSLKSKLIYITLYI